MKIIRVDNYFECDEKITEAILILNNKGYITDFCCSGHPGDITPYVSFTRIPSQELMFGEMPVNWIDDITGSWLTVRRYFEKEDYEKYTEEELIDIAMKELLEWAKILPESIFSHITKGNMKIKIEDNSIINNN